MFSKVKQQLPMNGRHVPEHDSESKKAEFSLANSTSSSKRTPTQAPQLTVPKVSSVLQVNAILQLSLHWNFQKLREFLQSFEHRDVLVSLSLEISSLPK
ncbi:hypothetical protein L6164_020975 [Bauhinia variegata]|uniref:Uncharacterized protein n=1 Tax=Bauhinia variegata TaxID=167791 RepID=A0ACB9MYS9_BAUVA|nr:hypothetical protein L6164_020975 [Bauhinia variegata]